MKQGADIYPQDRRAYFIDLYERRAWRDLLDEFNAYGLSATHLEYCCGIHYVQFWSKNYIGVWKKDMKK